MDEQTLRIFLSLAETQNTRDTAAELRINQSNVSRALARLEDEVGMALFSRHGKRLELNANGLAFRADAAGVLDAVESARRHAELIADEGRLLRVGFLHSVARWMVPDVIQRFRALRPTCASRCDRASPATLRLARARHDRRRSEHGTAGDVGDLRRHRLARARRGAAVHRRAHRSPARDGIRPGRRARWPGATSSASRASRSCTAVTGILDEADVTVNVTFESSEIDTMRSLVAGGLGVSILPRTPGRDDPGVVYLPLEPQRVRAIGIAWSTTAQGSATRRSWSPRCGSGEGLRLGVAVAASWGRIESPRDAGCTSSTRPRN
jgi:DNA-binding transcriptional LysR family regulator